jgi:hypothetical protein
MIEMSSEGYLTKGVSAGTQHPGISAPAQHLVVNLKNRTSASNFTNHKVLRKTVKIVEKWLKVLKMLIVTRAEGADWMLKVPRC